MRVINGKIIRYAGDGTVHPAAAEVFGGDDFAGGGFYEGGACEEDCSCSGDYYAFVGHGGDVRSAGGAGAHYDRDLGDGEGRHWGGWGLVVWWMRRGGGKDMGGEVGRKR